MEKELVLNSASELSEVMIETQSKNLETRASQVAAQRRTRRPAVAPESSKLDYDIDKPKRPSIAYMRERDRELVRGIFRYYEVPGGLLEFVHKAYPKDPVEKYSLKDGHQYTIPLGVARHLNKNVSYPLHEHMMGEAGQYVVKVKTNIRRCGFQSLEFMDIDDLSMSPEISTVEYTSY
jgi:hypothetical protein